MMRGRITDHVQPPQPKRPKTPQVVKETTEDIEAKLKQVIKEQEQTFLRLVEERKAQVARIEDQSRDIQLQVPGNLSFLFISFGCFYICLCCC